MCPSAPKAEPGTVTTFAFLRRREERVAESFTTSASDDRPNRVSTRGKAKKVPWRGGHSRRRVVAIASSIRRRRRSYSSTIPWKSRESPRSAAREAHCAGVFGLLVVWLWRTAAAFATAVGPARYPIRQPVIAKVFETEEAITTRSTESPPREAGETWRTSGRVILS